MEALAQEQGYAVAGSWDDWASAEKMREEAPGVFTHAVVVTSREAEFQIWVDGSPQRRLCPPMHRAAPGSPALAMVADASDEGKGNGTTWLIAASGGPRRCLIKLVIVGGRWRSVTWDEAADEQAARSRPGTALSTWHSLQPHVAV